MYSIYTGTIKIDSGFNTESQAIGTAASLVLVNRTNEYIIRYQERGHDKRAAAVSFDTSHNSVQVERYDY